MVKPIRVVNATRSILPWKDDGTFTETRGTIFYRKRRSHREIMEALALITKGIRVSSVARVKGHKEDTVVVWLREVGEHAEVIEAELLNEYRIEQGQLDAIPAFKGKRGKPRRRPLQV